MSEETAILSWCPVHGTALCPEDYMLCSDGRVAAGYHGVWSEDMRCGRRLHAVPVQWEWDAADKPVLYHPHDGELPDDPDDFPLFTLRRPGGGSKETTR